MKTMFAAALVAAIALLCLWFTRKLPTSAVTPATEPDRAAPSAPA